MPATPKPASTPALPAATIQAWGFHPDVNHAFGLARSAMPDDMWYHCQFVLNSFAAHLSPGFLSPSAPATAPSSIPSTVLTPSALSKTQGHRSQSPSYASANTGTPATTIDISSTNSKKKTPAKPHEIILKTSSTAPEHRLTTKALVIAIN